MRLIVFSGPKTSGKDTAAQYLLARNSLLRSNLFEQHNFADSLKNACSSIFGFSPQEMNDMPFKEQELDRWPFSTPRLHLQNVAKLMRTFYGGDVWVKRWESRIKLSKAKCIVVTDLRHMEELDKLVEMQAIIIYVENNVAQEKLMQAIADGDAMASDVSESHYIAIRAAATAVITNNGSISELHAQVHKVAEQHLGDWSTWGDMEPVL